MPYIQPATQNIFGLMPVTGYPGSGQTNLYFVSSSEATAILPGDAIVRSSLGSVRAAVTADSLHFMGAAAQALTTAEFAIGTQNLLVYDDPLQTFVISNTSGTMTLLMIGQNMGLVTTSTNPGIPNANVGRSKHAIGISASSAGPLRLMGMHPIEAFTSAPTAGNTFKWLVKAAPGTDFAANLTT